jgi:hypothetical protein
MGYSEGETKRRCEGKRSGRLSLISGTYGWRLVTGREMTLYIKR